jgi:PTH1 family peptidyl-tRNA hydrolase
MKVLVGLGNSGAQYEDTRHNLGFRVVRYLAKKLDITFVPSKICRGLESSAEISGVETKLLLPMTFMNLSGNAVKPFVAVLGVPLDDVLVVYDDFHLMFGQIRLRRKGSDGGHNGVRSIIENLGTDQFPRLRLGVGEPKGKQDAADFVLSAFDHKEKEELDFFIQEAADCCRAWVIGEIEQVMSQFNKRKGDG